MPLPQTQFPLFPLVQPSTGKTFMFRSFLVPEEKILLLGKESGKITDIGLSIQQVIRNCCVDGTLDTSTMTAFDMDYLFIKLRAASISNTVKVAVTDDDGDEYEILVDLDDVQSPVTTPLPVIDVEGTTSKMRFKYPTIKEIDEVMATDLNGIELFDHLMCKAVAMVYNDDEVFEFTFEELVEWVGTRLSPKTYDIMKNVIGQTPVVTYVTHYTNKAGAKKEVVLRGLEDFFTFA